VKGKVMRYFLMVDTLLELDALGKGFKYIDD
jgi:hypothetical protein